MGDPKTMRVSAIVLALVLCLARANEYDFDNDVPEELLSRTEAVVPEEMLTRGLHSVSGLSTPVAINARTGDVQCMSTNGKDCWWGRCRGRKVPRHGRLRPLVCGAHHKKMWGGTGYNNKRHWCNKVKKPVAKMCKQRKLIRRPLRRRL